MSTIPRKTTWQVTTLTPLHIGSGYEMQIDMDYYPDRRSLHVIDLDELLQGLDGNEHALQEFGRDGFRLGNFMRSYHLKAEGGYRLPFGTERPPRIVRQFVKDGFGRAYVPGSSIKGALRTALWVNCLDRSALPDAGNKKDDFKIFSKTVGNLAGKDPNHDFLRPLKMGDGSALPCTDNLRADEVKFFNIRTGDKPGWKDFGTKGRPTIDSFKKAQGIAVETLREHTHFFVQMSMETFLLERGVKGIAGLPACEAFSDTSEFCRIMNRHALNMIETEKNFFAPFNTATSFVLETYKALGETVLEAAKTEHCFVLRMAWGSGWTGMTGDWIDAADMPSVRTYARPPLGRKNMPFPKTRRLIMRDGRPCLPPGWLIFRQVENEKYMAALSDSVSGSDTRETVSITGHVETPASRPEPQAGPTKTPEQAREEQLGEFVKYLDSIRQLPPVVATLVSRIESQEDPELQKEMTRAVLSKAKSMTKTFKKAKKEGKSWVAKIEDLDARFGQNKS